MMYIIHHKTSDPLKLFPRKTEPAPAPKWTGLAIDFLAVSDADQQDEQAFIFDLPGHDVS